jgi:hypothetical protein
MRQAIREHDPDRLFAIIWRPILIIAVIAGFFIVQHQDRVNTDNALSQGFYQSAIKGVQKSRDGCQRTNEGLRQPLYDFISDAIRTRRHEAAASKDGQRVADLVAIQNYSQIRRSIVRSSSDVALSPGSPRVNCDRAFPYPHQP